MIAAHDFYENRYASFWITDGILFFSYKPDTVIGIEAAKCVVADRISFQDERRLPVLCDMQGVVSVDKPARDYLAKSGSVLALAVALLVAENVSLTVSTFYLEISKPAVTTRIFTDQSEALAYLSSFLEPKSRNSIPSIKDKT